MRPSYRSLSGGSQRRAVGGYLGLSGRHPRLETRRHRRDHTVLTGFLAGAVTVSCPEQDAPRLRSSAAGQGWSPTRAIARVWGTPSISRLVIVAARAPRVPSDRSLSAMANTTP